MRTYVCGDDFPWRERLRDGGGWIDFVLSPIEILEGVFEMIFAREPRLWCFLWGLLHGLGLRYCLDHRKTAGVLVPGSRRRGFLAIINGIGCLVSFGTYEGLGSRYFGRTCPRS